MPLHQYQKQQYLKIGVIAALIILPVAGFFAGAQYQKQVGGDQSANTSQDRRSGPRMMGGGAVGTVKSVSDTSIVITDRMQGTEKTFTLTGDTTYKNGKETAARTDIKEGDSVLIQTDRTETTKATSVTLNPTFQQPSDSQGSDGGPVMFTN